MKIFGAWFWEKNALRFLVLWVSAFWVLGFSHSCTYISRFQAMGFAFQAAGNLGPR